MWHVDDDAAGRVALPGLGEGKHVGALARRQAAAIAAEKDFHGPRTFLHGDGKAFAIVGWIRIVAGRRLTAGQVRGEAYGGQDAHPAATAATAVCKIVIIVSRSRSIENESIFAVVVAGRLGRLAG